MAVGIMLADDHTIFRQGLRLLLEGEPDMKVVAEVGSGTEAAEAMVRVRPDVLITDLRMPGLNGIELTKKVKKLSPETKVIILSMFGDKAYILRALENGAKGYVVKESSASELVLAIREALAGRCFVSESVMTDRIRKRCNQE